MASKEEIKGSSIVLKCEREDGAKFEVSPDSFSFNDFKGVKVSGHEYYVKKARGLGAK